MQRLVDYIKSLVDVTDNDLSQIIPCFEQKELSKNSFILKQGQISSAYIFIASGALRIFSGEEPNDATLWIAFENEFIAELQSIKSKMPSSFSIQAIEDCEIITIESAKMENLYNQIPVWQAFGRQLWEKAFLNCSNNLLLMQTKNASDRYKKAVLETEYIKRVPLKYLSSFLGITQTSLSRLRKTIK